MDLILASTSLYRRALLQRLGLAFHSQAPQIEESSWKDRGLEPKDLAEQLARAKASSLCEQNPEATIIGGDQLVSLDGRVLGKPGTAERAIEQLACLTGTTHTLITALALWHRGGLRIHTDVAHLTMRSLSDEEIRRYVAAEEPLDCAGAYKVESRGIVLFERIESDDQTAISGLPLIALTGMLRQLGYRLP